VSTTNKQDGEGSERVLEVREMVDLGDNFVAKGWNFVNGCFFVISSFFRIQAKWLEFFKRLFFCEYCRNLTDSSIKRMEF
jgi:hypothetical protein